MRISHGILSLLILVTEYAAAQKSRQVPDRELTPARGFYKQLAAFNPKSRGGKSDDLRFPYDPATAERRLSLTPVYLTDVSAEDFAIADAPMNSSEQTLAELEYLYSLQKRRTAEEVRASLYMAKVYYNLRVKPSDSTYRRYRSNLFQIGHSIGTWFNADDMPLTAELMANVWRDASFFIWKLKYKYARVRPYKLDTRLKNLEETDWAAYPSGHASNSYVNAYVYSELAPEFADYFIKDAYDMAHSREILGVHYPSDSESARVFARQVVNKLFANERFLADFSKVKEEWRQKARETLGR